MSKILNIIISTMLCTLIAVGFMAATYLIGTGIEDGTLGQDWSIFGIFLMVCSMFFLVLPYILCQTTKVHQQIRDEALTPSEHQLLNYAECSDL